MVLPFEISISNQLFLSCDSFIVMDNLIIDCHSETYTYLELNVLFIKTLLISCLISPSPPAVHNSLWDISHCSELLSSCFVKNNPEFSQSCCVWLAVHSSWDVGGSPAGIYLVDNKPKYYDLPSLTLRDLESLTPQLSTQKEWGRKNSVRSCERNGVLSDKGLLDIPERQ